MDGWRLVDAVILGFVLVVPTSLGTAAATTSWRASSENPACPVVQGVEHTRHHDATRQLVGRLCSASPDGTPSAGSAWRGHPAE